MNWRILHSVPLLFNLCTKSMKRIMNLSKGVAILPWKEKNENFEYNNVEYEIKKKIVPVIILGTVYMVEIYL